MADAQQIAGVVNLGQIAQDNQAAQQAAQQYQNGDIKGAYATMIQANPDWASKMVPDLVKIDPDLAAMAAGKAKTADLNAETQFGSNPNQLENVRGQYMVKAYAARSSGNHPRIAPDKNSPTGFSMLDPSTGTVTPVEGYGIQATPGAKSPTSSSTTGVTGQTQTQPQPIAPQAQTELNKGFKEIKSDPDFKDFNTEINGLEQAKQLAKGNLPGGKQPLVMKFLTSSEFVKRFNEGEYKESPAEAQSIINQVQNWLSEKGKGKLDPTVMQNFADIIDTMQHGTLNEYQGALESKASELSSRTNGKLSKDQAMAQLLGASNPIFKQKAQNYAQLPQQDREAVDWARKNLGNPKALQILRMHGL